MKESLSKMSIFLVISLMLFNKGQSQVLIPDPNFVAWLNANGFSSCMNGNILIDTCATVVSTTTIDCSFSNISDLTGIAAFPNLNYLYCWNNQLTSLPLLPPSLIYLLCMNNQLTSLPTLPPNLSWLECDFNQLTNLPTLPSSLTMLRCQGNQLNSLPTLPNSLTELNCSGNLLVNLPSLPNSLTHLYCAFNQLLTLPSLPSTLTTLFCYDNLISTIPPLPNSLSSFWCRNNLLQSLPQLPSNLGTLDCSGNQLTNLPTLPSGLSDLWCGYNQLISLPALPSTLNVLDCPKNQLTNLPPLPYALYAFQVDSNPKLHSMPILMQFDGSTGDFRIEGTGIKCLPNTIQHTGNTPEIDTMPICENRLEFSNSIQHNINFQDTLLLETSKETSMNVFRICADGSKATLVEFFCDSCDLQYAKFRMKSDTMSTDTALSGSFNSNDYTHIGYDVDGDPIDTIVKCWFTHPTYSNSASVFKIDTLQIIDSISNVIYFENPIVILKAPVALIHGLWSNGDEAFSALEDYLWQSHLEKSIIKADYSLTNASYFWINDYVVPYAIDGLFHNMRGLHISAGKADLVGHSMGGILSRKYLQDIKYRNDVNKLITVNTPHAGTQIANFLMNGSFCILKVKDIVNYFKPVNEGAITDLSVNSTAMTDLNITNLNFNKVPSHAIITTAIPANISSWGKAIANLAISSCVGYPTIDEFLDSLYFGAPNDIIVPSPSQECGLTTISTISTQWHSSTTNPAVISRIDTLLNANPNNAAWFSTNGFYPPVLQSHYRLAPDPDNTFPLTPAQPLILSGLVNIISPSTNTSFNSGQNISINVTSVPSISKLICITGNEYSPLEVEIISGSSGTFNYTIPDEFIGQLKVLVSGYDSLGFVDLDTIFINATTTALLDSITCNPNSVVLPKGATGSVSVTGHFSDGLSRSLNYVDSVEYLFTDTTIAERIINNTLKGKKIGSTLMTVIYQGDSVIIPVDVFPSDTAFTISVTEMLADTKRGKLEMLIYPNPANGKINIRYTMLEKDYIDLSMYDIIGNKISTIVNGFQLENSYEISFKNENLQTGIYFFKLSSQNGYAISKKVIFIR